MSLESYIRLYQELLTMVDPDNDMSVEYVINILQQILVLARQSNKIDGFTARCMHTGVHECAAIARHRDEFAGKPGDFHGNQAKRMRLQQMLGPHC